MAKPPNLIQTGTTEANEPVMAGVFTLVSTHGVLLELIVDRFKDLGWVVDWPAFFDNAITDGWNPRRTLLMAESVIRDIYGNTYGDNWLVNANLWMNYHER